MLMFNTNILNRFLDYKTQYFNSISEYLCKFNLLHNMTLNVLNCNIRSARRNFDEFLLFLENDIHSKNLDLIVLTETWHDVNFCNFSIHGYNTYFSKLKRNQNDGVIIFIKTHLCADIFEYEFLEANTMKVTLKLCNVIFRAYCIYRLPSSDKNKFLTTISSILSIDECINGHVII